ncbi:Short-chain dehydrogenase TIC 32, chloroplastic, partial [Ananas comosus]
MLETVKYLIGYPGSSGFGSKSTAEEVTAASPDLRSITAIITGATSGIGAETARVLARRGARLVLPARSLKAAEEARARLGAEFPGAEIVVLPSTSAPSPPSDPSVQNYRNNAGKFSHEHAISEDGIEMTFATNYLGHFLLTKLLMEKMKETAKTTGIQGRVVNVSSSIHGWFSGDGIRYLDLITRMKIPYDPTQAYAFSKLANVLHTKELAERLKEIDANVTANCVHPGIVRTRLTRDREGFVTGVSGKYFSDCNEASPSSLATGRREAARLWRVSESIIAGRQHLCQTEFKHKPEPESESKSKQLVHPKQDPTRRDEV